MSKSPKNEKASNIITVIGLVLAWMLASYAVLQVFTH